MTTPTLPQLTPLTTYTSGPIRRFTDARIQAAVDEALMEAGPNDPVVVVAHQVWLPGEGVNKTVLSAMVRLPAGFSVMAGGFKDWTKGDLGAEAKIIWKPKF
jgi:hypothetical protein